VSANSQDDQIKEILPLFITIPKISQRTQTILQTTPLNANFFVIAILYLYAVETDSEQ